MIKRIAILLALVTVVAACGSDKKASVLKNATQADIVNLANALDLHYTVVDNRSGDHCDKSIEGGLCFKGQIKLTSSKEMLVKGWEIYFSEIQPIYKVKNDNFVISHIKGDLHRLTPTEKFKGFKAGESIEINFISRLWHLSESDVMPNYYITAKGLHPQVIVSTQPRIDQETGLELRPNVTSFSDPEAHFKRSADDKTQWATANNLYRHNQKISADATHIDSAIIPTPKSVVVDPSTARLDLSTGLAVSTQNIEMPALNAALQRLTGLGIKLNEKGVETKISVVADQAQAAGSYQLTISAQGIEIVGVDDIGAFYALQSIASLLTVGQSDIPLMKVIDSPRFDFRGMHIDVARNFNSQQFIFNILDQMAAYKLNKFHFHLADDEGWRLEIPGLPELTDIGSKRCHDLEERTCLLPQLGHGPDANSPASGYFSRDEYIQIVEYANARHIQVIPSLDMPGHSRSSVKSMQARYHRLTAEGKEVEASEYLLTDFYNISKYSTVQYYDDNTINACLPSSYHFIEKVMDEMVAMHKDAGQPLVRYHIGADESEHAWDKSPVCEKFIAANPKVKDLGSYFIGRVAKILSDRGIIAGGWSDGMSLTNKQQMPKKVQVNSWEHLAWGITKTNELTNRGWEMVISTPDVLYFDFPYEADPKERGYYWASRASDSEKVFNFMPENLPIMAEIWPNRSGGDYEADDRLQKDENGAVTHSPLKPGITFAGMQGQIWSESIRTDNQKSYMVFPRFFALAERAWHKADWEVDYNYEGALYNHESGVFTDDLRQRRDAEFNRFANVIGQKTLAKLDLFNVFYRVPTVGAEIKQGKLSANVVFPGLGIEFRSQGGSWQPYTGEVAVSGQVEVRAIAANGIRKGRTLIVE